MADRIPIVIEGSTLREISNGDRLDISGNALQVGGNITPDADSTYDIGTSSLKFRDIYLSGGTIHLGGVKLRADGNQLSIQDSTGAASAIAAASLQNNTTDDLTEGSTNLFYTVARADSAARSALLAIDAGGDGSFSYDSATGKFTYTGPSASETRAHFQVLDTGGDGSLTYDSATGNFTYTGPTPTEVRAKLVAGTGVTYDSAAGRISIDQPVGTTDNVTFAKVTMDSAVVDQVSFNTAYVDSHIAFEEGAMFYDQYHKTMNFYNDIDYPIEIGTQMVERVYNNTGSTILKGKPLYYSGNITSTAGIESPTVALANATSATKYNVQGLAAEDIADASYGYIVVAGVIDGFDTSGLNAGENFFAGLTDGAVQNAPPVYPNYPMCLGWVIKSDATDGKVVINQQNHSVNTFRVQGDAHIGADMQVDGNLTVLGTQTIASTENISIGGAFNYFNAGDTIGETNTAFVGSGLDDAFFSGHYNGDSSNKGFYAKIDATGTPDTFEWGHDSTVGAIATGISITGAAQELAFGISIDFGATTGHTSGDKWTGSASPVNVDTGWGSNRNTGTSGVGYTHIGVYYDVSAEKFRMFDQYYPEVEGSIDPTDSSYNAATLVAGTFEGNLTGNVTGDLSGNATTATTLATGRTISLTGDVTGTSASFDGSGNVSLAATIAANSVALGTDTTGNYVQQGATSGNGISGSVNSEGGTFTVSSNATNANTASTIVFRDGSGNFSAGTITASLSGNVTGNVTGNADTATALATGRNFSLTGDVTAAAVSFDGTGNVALTTALAANTVSSTELVSASTLTIKNTAGTTLKTVIGAGS